MSEAAIQNDNTTTPATSKGKKPKAATRAAARKVKEAAAPKTKAAKPKRERAPKEDLMTFAFRMTKPESAALHKAAGPANASRVMRALAGAFVAEDRAVFEAIVEDARKLR